MTFSLENKKVLQNNEAAQHEEMPAHKKLKRGAQRGREISEQTSRLLQLPVDILGKIVRCVDWKSRDTLHLTLTCKKLKRITEARPHVRLAKVFAFIESHPLKYCKHGVHERLLKLIPSLLSSITMMPEDEILEKDLKRFNQFSFVILKCPLPSYLIPLIAKFVEIFDFRMTNERYAKLPSEIQKAYDHRISSLHAFEELLKRATWTQKEIEAIPWSLLLNLIDKSKTSVANHENITAFFTNLKSSYQPFSLAVKLLSDEALLVLLNMINEVQVPDIFLNFFFQLVAKSDDQNFMLKALKINFYFFEYCSPRLKQNSSFLLSAAAQSNGQVLQCPLILAPRSNSSHFPIGQALQERLQTDKDLLLEFLKSFHPQPFSSTPCMTELNPVNPNFPFPSSFSLAPRLADDEEWMKEAIKYSDVIFQYASSRLKESKEMILLFLQYHPSLSKVSKHLLRDNDIVSLYVEKTGRLKDLLPDDKKRREIALKALEKNHLAFFDFVDSLQKDESLMLEAAERNPLILLIPSLLLHQKQTASCIPPIFQKLLQNRSLVLKALQQKIPNLDVGSLLFENADFQTFFQKDPEVALAAAKHYPQSVNYFDPELIAQEGFIDALFNIGLTHLNLDLMPHQELDKQEMNDSMEIETIPALKPRG